MLRSGKRGERKEKKGEKKTKSVLLVPKVLLQGLVDKLVVLSPLATRRLGSLFGRSCRRPRRPALADGGHDDTLDLLLGLEAGGLAAEGEALRVGELKFFWKKRE